MREPRRFRDGVRATQDLRQWDEAKAFAQASKNVDATELTRKQAEWAEETSDWSAAADLQVSAGNALQAVRLLHEHKPEGWIEKLSLIVRRVAAEDVLRQCARAFLANGADPCGNTPSTRRRHDGVPRGLSHRSIR